MNPALEALLLGSFGVLGVVIASSQVAIELGHEDRLPGWLRMRRSARTVTAIVASALLAGLGVFGILAIPIQERMQLDVATALVILAEVGVVAVWLVHLFRSR